MKWMLALLLCTQAAFAENYILCSRDAEITPVKPSEVSESDPCSGTVLLQGISYACTETSEVDSKRRAFLADLKKNGREYCEDFCRKRSTHEVKCRGVFAEPSRCGFTVPTREALKFGKTKAVCNPECGGQAFAYCSIYHSSTLRVDPELFSGQRPNCTCERAN